MCDYKSSKIVTIILFLREPLRKYKSLVILIKSIQIKSFIYVATMNSILLFIPTLAAAIILAEGRYLLVKVGGPRPVGKKISIF